MTLCGGWTTGDDNITCTAADELIDALAGNDTINAGAGDDVIFGSAGNDVIEPMAGDDTIYAGAGDDDITFYSIQSGTKSIFGGDGTDELRCTGGGTNVAELGIDTTFSLAANSIENIVNCGGPSLGDDKLVDNQSADNVWDFSGMNMDNIMVFSGSGNDTITGSSGDDEYINTSYGDDIINAGDGNDAMQGGDGNDQMDGGAGNDTFYYNWLSNPPGDDTVLQGGTGDDTIYCSDANGKVSLPATFDLATNSIENIINCTASGNELLDGGNRINTWDFTGISMTNDTNIRGMGGADTITGSAGNEDIDGGADNDIINGGPGADDLDGGSGDDTFVYNEGHVPDDDSSINGGLGNDTIHCDTTNNDVPLPLTFSQVSNSIEYITNCLDSLGNQVDEDDAFNRDNIWDFTGITLDEGTGIYGKGGNDTITGSASGDVISGGLGNDTLDGAGGNDIFYYPDLFPGSDVSLQGGTGTDTIAFNPAANGYASLPTNFDLATNSIEAISASFPTYGHYLLDNTSVANNVWDFTGITGTSSVLMHGWGGNDTITGTANGDHIVGSLGNDTLNGAGGNDVFYYEGTTEGTDDLDGGAGTDYISCSSGVDVLVGLETTFNLATQSIEGFLCDNSTDYQAVVDFQNVANTWDFTGITGLDGVNIDAGLGADNVTGSAIGETIYGTSGNDTLDGAGGNDLFYYIGTGMGVDTILGGTGTDTIACDSAATQTVVYLPATFNDATNSIEQVLCNLPTNQDYFYDGSDIANTWDFSGVTTGMNTVAVYGRGGVDVITGATSTTNYIVGGSGDDTLTGGSADDIFYYDNTTPGTDTIDGGAGFDYIALPTYAATAYFLMPSTFTSSTYNIEAFAGSYPSQTHEIRPQLTGDDNWDFSAEEMSGVIVYSYAGDDVVSMAISSTNSYYNLGLDNDTLIISDDKPTDINIDGGAGVSDTVALTLTGGVSSSLDLWLIGNNFEFLDISNTTTTDSVNITIGSITSPTYLYIKGDPSDDVWSLDTATRGTDVNVSGIDYGTFINGGGTLYVEYGLDMNGVVVASGGGSCSPAATTGDDTITCTGGGNTLDALAGDDTIIYTDELDVGTDTLDGSTGTDTVWLNFTTAVSSSLDTWLIGNNFEYLDISNTTTTDSVNVTIGSITSPTSLYIKGDAGDDVWSLDTATRGTDVNVSGVNYGTFTNASGTLYVEYGLDMDGTTVAGCAPAPTAGDDTVTCTGGSNTVDLLGGDDTLVYTAAADVGADTSIDGNTGTKDTVHINFTGGYVAEISSWFEGNGFEIFDMTNADASDAVTLTVGGGQSFYVKGDAGDNVWMTDSPSRGSDVQVDGIWYAEYTKQGKTVSVQHLLYVNGVEIIPLGLTACTGWTTGDDNITCTAADEFINALAGNDTIDPGAGNDTIYAGPGNDTIYAGVGNNTMYGQDGDDTFHFAFGSSGAIVTLDGGAGNDTIYQQSNFLIALPDNFSAADSSIEYWSGSRYIGINNGDTDQTWDFSNIISGLADGANGIYLYGGNDVVTGNDENNTIRFEYSSSQDSLVANAGLGNDKIMVRHWVDLNTSNLTLDGGPGTDELGYVGEGGCCQDLLLPQNFSQSTWNIEIIQPYTFGGDIRGITTGNTWDFTGITTGATTDILTGGAADTFTFGNSHGTVSLESGDDTLIYATAFAGTLCGRATWGETGGTGTDTFWANYADGVSHTINTCVNNGFEIIDITNTNAGDSISANVGSFAPSPSAVYIKGDTADNVWTLDSVTRGADTNVNGVDYAVYTADSTGNDVLYVQFGLVMNGVGIASAACTPAPTTGNDNITCGTGDDFAIGLAGVDFIYGQDGNDEIHGNDGADWLYGKFGNDTIYGGSGTDYIYTGEGNDIAYGGDDNDTIYGGNNNGSFAMGNDTYWGGAGDDTINMDQDADTAYGEAGNDTFSVRATTSGIPHTVYGGDGTDTFACVGTGRNLLPNDFSLANYSIEQFSCGISTMDLAPFTDTAMTWDFTGITGVGNYEYIYTSSVNDTITGADDGNIIYSIQDSGTKTITGGSGNDTFLLEHLADATETWTWGGGLNLSGGAGTDTLLFQTTGCNTVIFHNITLPANFDVATTGIERFEIEETQELCVSDKYMYFNTPNNVTNVWDFSDATFDAVNAPNLYFDIRPENLDDTITLPTGGTAGYVRFIAGGGNDTVIYQNESDLEDMAFYGGSGGVGVTIVFGFSTGASTTMDNWNVLSTGTPETVDMDNGLADSIAVTVGSLPASPSAVYIKGDVGTDSVWLLDATTRGADTTFNGTNYASYTADSTGNDVLHVQFGLLVDGSLIASATCTPAATTGNDTINCTTAAETVFGLAGDDTIYASSGDDTVYGNDGADVLYGGSGYDTIYGGDGADIIRPENNGGLVYGDAGNDTIYSTSSSNLIYGGAGDDTFNMGSSSSGTYYGEDDNDTFTTGSGFSTSYGGPGDDIFNRNTSATTGPNNTSYGDAGTDTLNCSNWALLNNTFDLATYSIEVIGTCPMLRGISSVSAKNWDFTGMTLPASITITGSPQVDTFTGSDAGEQFGLGDGDDILNAGGGNDTVLATVTGLNVTHGGAAGNDTLNLGDGDDVIIYLLLADIGGDTIDGGTGNDTVDIQYTGGYSGTVDSWLLGKNIEFLDLTNGGNDTPSITVSSINGTLYIKGDGSGDDITTLDTPTHVAGGDVNVGGINYGAFTSGGDTMYVEFGLNVDGVTVVANP
jgi:Ca2+-binding RTX toxin-like protein